MDKDLFSHQRGEGVVWVVLFEKEGRERVCVQP
jgi:hypothetical protein